ncbi:MAG: hypothetical protein HQM16_15270 [Deltaproteobacteria bacterium]|nr:hypothetical protein [Deltaproteobacteria bacterium]
MFDCCIIGPITRDINIINGVTAKEQTGGTVYYTALASKKAATRGAL